eukprot:SAG11_NODE_15028_length_591_cov_1.010163_1_plen_93_part_10
MPSSTSVGGLVGFAIGPASVRPEIMTVVHADISMPMQIAMMCRSNAGNLASRKKMCKNFEIYFSRFYFEKKKKKKNDLATSTCTRVRVLNLIL